MGDKPIPDPYVLWPPASAIPPHHQNLVTREDWGARRPIRTHLLPQPTRFVRLNYTTETDRCMNIGDCIRAVQKMQNRDIETHGMTDIQYNFLVGGDAKIYVGRGWGVAPNPSVRYPAYENRYLEVAYIGDHKGFTVQPSFGMMKAAWELLEFGINNKYLTEDFTFL